MVKSDYPPLTSAQHEIMEVVWERREVTVAEVWDSLAKRRARNTVLTMMTRLERKGWLKSRKENRKLLYSAKFPRNVSLGAKVVQLINRFFAGSPEDMVTALLNHRGLTEEEAKRIRAMLDAAEAKSKKRGRHR